MPSIHHLVYILGTCSHHLILSPSPWPCICLCPCPFVFTLLIVFVYFSSISLSSLHHLVSILDPGSHHYWVHPSLCAEQNAPINFLASHPLLESTQPYQAHGLPCLYTSWSEVFRSWTFCPFNPCWPDLANRGQSEFKRPASMVAKWPLGLSWHFGLICGVSTWPGAWRYWA